MDEKTLLTFLLSMKHLAKEARARGRRVHYTEAQRATALAFLSWVEGHGGSAEDAAELMSVNRATLDGWLDWYTDPRRPVAVEWAPDGRITVRIDPCAPEIGRNGVHRSR